MRRIGPAPAQHHECSGCHGCPDILELDNGDFAIIGTDITEFARELPAWAGCAAYERIVRIPRQTLVLARTAIPVI
jgi:hypothetical protein